MRPMSCSKKFCSMVKTQFEKDAKVIWSGNGGEFVSNAIKKFYAEKGIMHQTSLVRTPQQNSRVERKHRHILKAAQTLMFQVDLPKFFWGEWHLTVAYLIN